MRFAKIRYPSAILWSDIEDLVQGYGMVWVMRNGAICTKKVRMTQGIFTKWLLIETWTRFKIADGCSTLKKGREKYEKYRAKKKGHGGCVTKYW